jgi:hypothetical protein
VTEPPRAGTGDATPYVLLLPAGATPNGMEWPGLEGEPAWAIPVTVPAGTRGYAVFVPLVQPDAPPTVVAAPVSPAPAVVEPAVVEPAVVEPAVVEPAVVEPAVVEPAVAQPAVAPPGAPAPGASARVVPVEPPVQALGPPAVPPPQAASMLPAPVPRFAPSPGPTFLETRWPGPAPARGRAVPAAVLAGALGLAVFLPLDRTGIGWFLGALVLAVGIGVAVRGAAAAEPRAERWIRVGWAVAALALLAVLTFRNAWWLVTFCVLAALGCATLAIIGGRLVRSILFSVVATPYAAVRGLPWVRHHLRARARAGAGRRVAWSVAFTAVVLLVFGALLASADAAFSQVLGDIFPRVDAGFVVGRTFLLAVGALITVAAAYTISAPPDLSTLDRPGRHRIGLADWGLPIGGLVVLFGGFVAVQFAVLFGGQRHVLETAGLDYAEYARSGFWQLVAVTVLTLAVLAGVTRWARRERPVEVVLLRVLLGLLCALSVVIVVSALFRMYTYQKVYSFTGERIFVMAFELLLGTVFVMIAAAGIRWRGAWIPRLTVALGVVLLLTLAVLNPEDYAARRNIARYEDTGKIDAWYLRALSADATPALATLPDAVRRCTLSWIVHDLAQPDPWYAWNLGRERARATLERIGPAAVGGPRDCRSADQFDLPKAR